MLMEQLTTELTPENDDTWRLKLIGSVASNYHLMHSTDDCEFLLNRLKETSARKLVIDLTATERLDSQGLHLLFNIYKEVSKNDIQIVLKNPNTHLHRLLRIMNFDRLFYIEFSNE